MSAAVLRLFGTGRRSRMRLLRRTGRTMDGRARRRGGRLHRRLDRRTRRRRLHRRFDRGTGRRGLHRRTGRRTRRCGTYRGTRRRGPVVNIARIGRRYAADQEKTAQNDGKHSHNRPPEHLSRVKRNFACLSGTCRPSDAGRHREAEPFPRPPGSSEEACRHRRQCHRGPQ